MSVKTGERASARFPDSLPLGEARERLYDFVTKGTHCPCCGQFAKVYKRNINAEMGRSLLVMWKMAKREWHHVPTVLGYNGGDSLKLRYWELIERQLGERKDGSARTGYWRITDKGEQWLRDEIAVPKFAYIYDSELLTVTGPEIYLTDVLDDNFDYSELMNS